MKEHLEKLVVLIDQKYPGRNYSGFVKIVIYCENGEGCGEIFAGTESDDNAETIFEFDDLDELVEHLSE